jgi:hypothetical protein
MTNDSDSQGLWKRYVSRRAALRAGILGAAIPGILYVAKSAASADAADGDIYIPGAPNFLELGYGWPGKDANAGKISYRKWSDGLDIVGAGTTSGHRKVKIWDDLYVPGLLNLRAYPADPAVAPTWTAFLYAKSVNGQTTKPFWKDATGTAQPLVARSATLIVAASNASPRSKLGADYVCDGTADEVEINAAIAALPAVGGKVVLTEGAFVLASNIIVKSKVVLEGQGYSSLITFNETIGVTKAIWDGGEIVTDVVIRSLRLLNTSTTTDVSGIELGWAVTPQRVTVENVEADNAKINITCGDGHTVRSCYVHGITAGGPDRAIGIDSKTGGDRATNAKIQGCLIETCHEMGIACDVHGAIVSGNIIVDAAQGGTGFAIDVGGATNITITGNYVKSKYGILSENGSGAVHIVDNHCVGTDISGGYGITVWRGDGESQCTIVNITGNTCEGMGPGITVGDENKVHIVGNLINGVGGNGIVVRKAAWGTDADDVHIDGNTILSWASNDDYYEGISVETANAMVANNYLDGDSQHHNRGIANLLAPGAIINNYIANTVHEAIYNIEAGVVVRDNIGYVTENSGKYQISGDGHTTTFNIAHGCSTTPTSAQVMPGHADARADHHISAIDGTNITVTFASAPPSGTNNIVLYWRAWV